MSWCTIESDPAVFNEMIERIGVKNTEVVEVPCLDADEIEKEYGNVYGLIFLFKWKPVKREVNYVEAPHVYFAKQVVGNACATQAIINILLNADGIDVGKELTEFKSFTSALDAEGRGECLGQQENIRAVHNSFSRPQCFSFEDSASGDEDAYHFTTYIPKDGFLYELDGLQTSPILAGDLKEGECWLKQAVTQLQERVSFVQSSDAKGNGLMFSLLAVTDDRIAKLEKELASSPDDTKAALMMSLKDAKQKGVAENTRRRHNYIPLVIECLKVLAQKGTLQSEADASKERTKQKREQESKRSKKE
eukprot:TRINITY_DN12823_c0_g1_i1.p1 TRINITY_DN12823_c0_g1~~TRINITY_DN12823_c0_g1_i1.p1  ORF type:complete len:322 (+),score=79.41 TRINITY_DN12823_c0_g1_i1:49-966(+)